MPQELLTAIREAEESEPAVRAAALLRIARVLTKIDQAEAERQLDRGLALLAELPEHERTAMTPQAKCLAACVSPERAFALRSATGDLLESKFLFDMARHGHVTASVEYLTQWSEEGEFPYDAARETMSCARDDAARRDILRSGLRAWHRRARGSWHSLQSLLQVFRFHWRLLPADEARHEVERLVRGIRERPNERLNGSFGGAHGTVTFSSYRPSLLFELLGPLRRIDPDLADAEIRENPELARAAALYPYGHDTDADADRPIEPIEPLSAEAREQRIRDWAGFALGLDSRFFLLADEQKSDFRDSFAHAARAFARDRRSNRAPRECWPSAEDFRTILYAAGRYEGASGARLLDRIPDAALRLFARIEFAAGCVGLDQIGGITREQAGSWIGP
jgi:hypothetical protein